MGVVEHAAVRALRLRYEQHNGDVDLREILARQPGPLKDVDLADIIETDARYRLASRRAVELNRYLGAIPDLGSGAWPAALDAAIDYSLRWLAPAGTGASDAAEQLIAEYPQLEDAIREAVVLGQAMGSVEASDVDAKEGAGAALALPRGFGPRLTSRRPRYLLKKVLGQGSHGTVYLAVDRHLSEANRPAWVAIKVLSSEKGGASPEARQHLVDEACKARRIDHRNVVRVLDWGTSETGEVYVVFEYVDGSPLDEWLRVGEWPRAVEAARLMATVARAVQSAHNAGLVHCDLKPGNIIITAAGDPLVADFGVAAREVERVDGAAWPDPQQRIGNLAFIAPEQYRCQEGSLAPPADVYALGGLLYYLLTRKLPNGDTPEQIGRTHDPVYGRTAAPSLRGVDGRIDRDLEAICRRALSPRRQDRYASADALASDLEAWSNFEPIPWTRPGMLRRMQLFWRRVMAARRAGRVAQN